MHFSPAVAVTRVNNRVIVEKFVHTIGITTFASHHTYVQRRQLLAISVVG